MMEYEQRVPNNTSLFIMATKRILKQLLVVDNALFHSRGRRSRLRSWSGRCLRRRSGLYSRGGLHCRCNRRCGEQVALSAPLASAAHSWPADIALASSPTICKFWKKVIYICGLIVGLSTCCRHIRLPHASVRKDIIHYEIIPILRSFHTRSLRERALRHHRLPNLISLAAAQSE